MPSSFPVTSSRAARVNEETPLLLNDPDEVGSLNSNINQPISSRCRPWWKRSSPWWLLYVIPFTAIAASATLAPRVEVYTMLACKIHRPHDHFSLAGSVASWWHVISTRGSGSEVLDDPKDLCASDPVVQAAVAKLIAVIAISGGILSSLTGAWWGAFSDRHGRTRVLGIATIGIIIADLNFIIVALFPDKLPGGYWFLITGPIVEGLLGGLTSGAAATQAYMADTISADARSRIFSLSHGLLFSGFVIGPTIGSLLIRFTGQVLSVFFLAASMHVLYAFFIWFIVPESLSRKQMQTSREKYEERIRESHHNHPIKRVAVNIKRMLRFLSPLAIFIPSVHPNSRGNEDWKLTFMALSYGLLYLSLGRTKYSLQYVTSMFGWNSEIIGYYISLMGIVRAVHLMLVIPALTKYTEPKSPTEHATSLPEERPLITGQEHNTSVIGQEPRWPSFDLNLARASMIIQIIGYVSMGLSKSGLPFVLSSVLLWLGSGVNPALQSAALAIYTRRGETESGRLFGALSVIQALCSHIIGPSLFGFVYATIVAWFPQGIFFISMIILSISFLLLCIVQLPSIEPPGDSVTDYDIENVGDLRMEDGDMMEPNLRPFSDRRRNSTRHRHNSSSFPPLLSPSEMSVAREQAIFQQELQLPVDNADHHWWKKPSPWWMLFIMPIGAIAHSLTIAPRVDIYTLLACKVHIPDIFNRGDTYNLWALLSKDNESIIHQRCASDPVVQAVVAKLIAAVAVSTGILSCLTGAWWATLSDRYGRTVVLGITVMGAIATDLNFILVTLFLDKVPGGYWFLIAGPLLEGLLGGLVSGVAANHAYLADTTPEVSRSRIFSLNIGILYIGFAVGPALGSLLIRLTGQVLSVFPLAAAMYTTYALLVWLIVPESVTRSRMQASREKHQERIRGLHSDHSFKAYIQRMFQFLNPLVIFIPPKTNSFGRKDWSLTHLALSYGLIYLFQSFTHYTIQYVTSTFHWNAISAGYYMSLTGMVRAIHLLAVIPVLAVYFNPKTPSELAVPLPEEEPLLSGPDANPRNDNAARKQSHSPSFDMNLALVSIIIEVVAYCAMGLSSSGLQFVLSSVLLWTGSGTNPAIQSVALAIYTRNGETEAGRLFGALSVVQALSAQIIGPAMLGFVYANTVTWFKQGIFFLAATILSISFLSMCIIRLPKGGTLFAVPI
ncbi:hypothetical protein APHAL10511_000969 [Amanita phalloides]|nr:hypothetical protein APHAL10511_000969 [Amanita phalloides]